MIPNYFSDEQLVALERNDDFRQRGAQCPVCLDDKHYFYQGDRYECPDDDYGHPMLRLAKLYWLHNIPMQYQKLLWSEFPHNDIREDIEAYLTNFRHIRHAGGGLTVFGEQLGVGKTWTVTHVLRELTKQGYDTWFVEFFHMKNYYELEDRDERQYLTKRLTASEILVIDDIIRPWGSEKQRAFFEEKLEEVIRTRTNMDFPTFITTNLEVAEFDRLYPRVYSLLSAKNQEFTLKGIDGRKDGTVFETHQTLANKGQSRPIT